MGRSGAVSETTMPNEDQVGHSALPASPPVLRCFLKEFQLPPGVCSHDFPGEVLFLDAIFLYNAIRFIMY